MIEYLLQAIQVKEDLVLRSKNVGGWPAIWNSIEDFTFSMYVGASEPDQVLDKPSQVQVEYPMLQSLGFNLSLTFNSEINQALLHLSDLNSSQEELLTSIEYFDPSLVDSIVLFTSKPFIDDIRDIIKEYIGHNEKRLIDQGIYVTHPNQFRFRMEQINVGYIKAYVAKSLETIKSCQT